MNALYVVVKALGQPKKLLHEYWAITSSRTYIDKELVPARIKKDIKAVAKRYNFSIETNTEEKKKTKIVEISAKTIRYPNTVTIMIYRV